MADFNPRHKEILDDLLLQVPIVRSGKMFGFPAYYVGKKLCICLYEQGVGVKVPEATAARLLLEDAHITRFQPLGKPPMRQWVQINLECSEDYRQYWHVFDESIRHVASLQGS